ncbi:ankyrin repeat domain-containing protein [Pusillimonas sp.]|uniref:ankyrin repeat domain-containing protein n=1 Tax=Pusillimonas sp. TaxID=3040095 RepID=UPI0037CC2701
MFTCQAAAASTPSDWGVDIANDRVEQVRNHLALGEDPNAVDAEGQPAIMQAIQDGAWKVYDLLVRHRKINVNAVNGHNETPLMYLSVIGQTKRAADLIAKGAEVNRLGWAPLHYAASKGHLETVKLLLANKAMVNAPSPDGTSPLMMAAYSGSEEVVRALLNAGADATARNLRGEDAADWARRKNHNQLAAQLDDLTDRVLRSRAARAAGSGAAASATTPAGADPSGQIHMLDTTKGALPDAVQRREQAQPQADGSSQAAEDSGSTSRYFDLDRFDREDGY